MLSVIVVLALLIPLVAVVLDSQLGRALAARLERQARVPDPGEASRLAALETEVERLGREIQRLEEQGDFLQRLLQEKARQDMLPPASDER
jgi:cell division protein FtsB